MAKFPLVLVYPEIDEVFETEDERCISLYGLSAYFRAGEYDEQDAGSWHDSTASLALILSIRYKDIGSDAIQIGFSNNGTTETLETVVTKVNSGEWKWKHYTLAVTAKFAHDVYLNFLNADFRLYSASELMLTNVTVKKVSTKARAVWRIDPSEEVTENDAVTGSPGSGSGGGTADPNATYVTMAAETNLPNERALAVGAGLSKVDGGAGGNVTLDLADAVAGAGLAIASKVLAVGAGAGIAVNANDVALNLASPSGLNTTSGLALDDSVAGAGLVISSKILAVGAGNGITVNANDVALTTPGTLTVATSNSASGNHTHAITSSSNPGAAAALLASDASGFLTLVKLKTDTLEDKSGGNLTIAPAGDIVLNPTGNDILPTNNYDLNLGALSKKYLTLHAAELWVETLVAQNTLATIGGRILILPTNILIADVGTGDTTLDVKYNNLNNGDRIYLEANGAVEFMAVTSGASVIGGGYRYSVTRNLDGSGANQWYAGDAIANTGQTGDGWIDAYSVRGVKASSEAGPTIAGNIRNSSTYNDWSTMWAVGNLNGLYGYGADTPGAAFGKYASGNPNITVDTTNGMRIRNFTTTVGQWDTSGNITVGEVGASKSNVYITSNKVQLRTNTTVHVELDTAGKIIVGEVANSKARIEISAGTINAIARSGAGADTTYFSLATTGNVTLGKVAASNANILFDASAGTLSFRVNTTTNIYINTSGAMVYSSDSASYAKWVTGSATIGEMWAGASGGYGTMAIVGRGKDATDTTGVVKQIAYKHDNSYNSQLALSSYGSVTLTGRDGVASQLTTLYSRDFAGGTTVQGTTTETTIYTTTINGNAMGAEGVVVIELGGDLKNNSGTTPNLTFRVKFGGTTVCTLKVSSISSFAATGGYFIRAVIANDGNTNAQRGFAMLIASRNGQWDGTSADYGTAAIDTTANVTVSITAQWSSSAGSPEAPGVFSKGGLVRLERTN